MIDTHAHLDANEFAEDIDDVLTRAQQAGIHKIFLPAISMAELPHLIQLCHAHPTLLYPMIGLHPENIMDEDYHVVLDKMEAMLAADRSTTTNKPYGFIAIGEVGLDLYWDKTYKAEQIEVFERQILWAKQYNLPLMIHSRAAHAELMTLMTKHYDHTMRGVFHCFTGTEAEARDLLTFPNFVLGIGGVLTFKKSTLPQTLATTVPLSRIVLETDAPYMAPVPFRGKRNESAFIPHIAEKLAQVYNTTIHQIDTITTATATQLFTPQ